ncbi:MAG: hypothetical protein V1909_06160, partial [Candidatus Micrarchaeota archaeon]
IVLNEVKIDELSVLDGAAIATLRDINLISSSEAREILTLMIEGGYLLIPMNEREILVNTNYGQDGLKVLIAVDSSTTLEEVVEKTGLTAGQVKGIINGLVELGIINPGGDPGSPPT